MGTDVSSRHQVKHNFKVKKKGGGGGGEGKMHQTNVQQLSYTTSLRWISGGKGGKEKCA